MEGQGARCLLSHPGQNVRVIRVATRRQTEMCRSRRTESRVRWKSAMLTLVVPESGSAAAALRAMVDAGSGNLMMLVASEGLRVVCWGLVVMGRLKELGGAGARCRQTRGNVPLIRSPARCGL